MKTIGFMISDQHLIPHGGIGQFCKSFRALCNDHGYQFVLITDKKPTKQFVNDIGPTWTFYPKQPLSYAKHRELYGRYEEGVCYEKIINFNTALVNASNFFDLDVIIANSHETYASLADAKINAKKVLYTHLYKQIYPEVRFNSIFNEEYHKFFQQFLYRDDVTVGTQSVHNKDMLLVQGIKNVDVLPMPMTETKLLESSDDMGKVGALYIGRWEEGKNPKDYLKLIKKFDLYPKVLTNKKGAEKFVKAFTDMGINRYDIRAGIIGQEKVDFIKSCKMFLNTSLIECYPNAVMETIGHMPIITLNKVKVPWPQNFKEYVHTIELGRNMKMSDVDVELIQEINDERPRFDNSVGLQFAQDMHDLSYVSWKNFIER